MSDLLELRARLESLGARARPPVRVIHELAALPLDCVLEATPFGEVAVRQESLPAAPDDLGVLTALQRCFPEARSGLDQPVFLDIETTGLSGGTGTVAFLVGVGWPEAGRLRLAQYFLRDLDQERALLWAVGSQLERHGALVTYNGRAFDWPLLQARLIMTRRHASWPILPHIDLLRIVRRLFRPRLKDCTLRTVEEAVLAIEREHDLPGPLIPSCYLAWLRRGADAGLEAVFLHNRQDVLTLAVLLVRLEAALRDAGRLHPVDRFSRARFLETLGFWQEARAEYQWLWGQGLVEYRGALGLRLARLLVRAGQWSEARAVLEECWATQAYPYQAAIELAKLLEHQLRDVHAARRLVTDALTLLAEAVVGDERCRRDLEWRRVRLNRRLDDAGDLLLGITG